MELRPSRKEFAELSSSHTIVPVWTEVAGDLETPVTAFLKTAGGPAFLLESVEQGERWGRFSFVGLDPFLTMTARDGRIAWQGDRLDPPDWHRSPLEILKELIEGYRAPALLGLPPLYAGAVGYLGYDVVRYLERLPQTTHDDVGAPELMMMLARTMLVFDHLRQRISVLSNVVEGDSYNAAADRIAETVERLSRPLAGYPAELSSDGLVELPPSTMSQGDFESAVDRAKKYIRAGDIFQVVLSQRFSVPLVGDAFGVYRMLRLVNPSPYMFFLRHPEVTVLGSSPEPLVKVTGDLVEQRPIAGTRPRGRTAAGDRALEAELLGDEKERAEHIMLVDLARNDVGRVARWGSVRVEELMVVERYSHVMHLVSHVSGRLSPPHTPVDALYASFPAGTVTGAPKIRAMEIIDELETTRRGPYAGVVGYFDFSGNIDTCIALRTGYLVDGVLHVQAGAGIVADSDPAKEWQECADKARAVLTAAAMAGS